MDTNKRIARAMLNKSFAEAKELVFKSLYAKSSLALDEARYAVANAIFNEAKKPTTYSVPAGASEEEFAKARAANPYRVRLLHPGKPAGAPADKAVKEEAELDEMAQTAERKAEVKKKMAKMGKAKDKSSEKLQKMYDRYAEKDYGTAKGAEEKSRWEKAETASAKKHLSPMYKLADQSKKEREDKTRLYGKGGKVVKK